LHGCERDRSPAGTDDDASVVDGDRAGREIDITIGRTGRASPRRSRSVDHAPGAGVHARTSRSIRNAGADQSMRASSTVSFGAYDTPSEGCGRATSDPSSTPSRVATKSPAPSPASRSSRSPAVSCGPMSTVSIPSTGPVSRPSSNTNVLTPVTSSP